MDAADINRILTTHVIAIANMAVTLQAQNVDVNVIAPVRPKGPASPVSSVIAVFSGKIEPEDLAELERLKARIDARKPAIWTQNMQVRHNGSLLVKPTAAQPEHN